MARPALIAFPLALAAAALQACSTPSERIFPEGPLADLDAIEGFDCPELTTEYGRTNATRESIEMMSDQDWRRYYGQGVVRSGLALNTGAPDVGALYAGQKADEISREVALKNLAERLREISFVQEGKNCPVSGDAVALY